MSAGGTLHIRTRDDALASEVIIEIEDSGTGIAPEHRAHVFDPFFTTKPAGTGTGLGLAVCYGIITAHGGRIEIGPVHSETGPVKSETGPVKREAAAPNGEAGPMKERGTRVRVVFPVQPEAVNETEYASHQTRNDY
jgi:signal transduction histidine kinase